MNRGNLQLMLQLCTIFYLFHACLADARASLPGPVTSVELWAQSTTVLSVAFDAPDEQTDVDMFRVEWALTADFAHVAQGFVMVSRALKQTSFQYDIVHLPRGMKEQVYVRVCAHNAAGWGPYAASNPPHFAIADDVDAPDISSRRGLSIRVIGSFMAKVFRFAVVLIVFFCIGYCITCCFARYAAETQLDHSSDYRPVSVVDTGFDESLPLEASGKKYSAKRPARQNFVSGV